MASNVEATTLFQIFNASFHSDPNVRISAELELKKLEPLEGLIPTLLQLMSPSSSTSSPVVRLAAAIYLKNRIQSSWRIPLNPSELHAPPTTKATPYTAIPPSDRQALKSNILPLLAVLAKDEASAAVKLQVTAVLAKIVDCDYTKGDWPGLVEEAGALLGGGEGEIEAGLRATVEILRGFRYNRPDPTSATLPSLIALLFPHLLSLGQRIQGTAPNSPASLTLQGTLLYLILKAYKNGISNVLVPALQSPDSIVPWGTLFIAIIQQPLPAPYFPLDDDEASKAKHPWSKAKKWAVASLNKLFVRYGNPIALPSNMKKLYAPFAERFISQFVPEIMRTYFGLVERIVGGEWNSSKTKHHVLTFLEECIKPKATWTLLKPHVQPLVSQFIFPLICLSEDEIEMFTEDPVEFSRTHFGDFIEDSYSNPCATSLTFIASLVETRKATTLLPLLNFIQEAVSKYPNETTPREKDGALRMLVSLATSATKSKKLAPMMEAFFKAHVLPEFKSPHGFLRYRACEVVEKFESCDMDWGDRNNLEVIFSAVMNAITDPELPVRIQAAVALPEMVRYEEVRARMVPNIGRIMQELLKLADEVDLDALTNTTRSLVAEFAEEVVPFAVELTQSLIVSYHRLVQEMIEAREKESEMTSYESVSFDEEKTLVCMNILKTVDQLVSSLETAPLSLDKVEAIVAPALEFTVRNNLVELYDEVFEILDSLSFFQKKISDVMWPLFESTYHSFKTDASDYFNEMFGCIDNFISFGSEVIATNVEYRKMLIDMFDTVMTSRQMGAEDRCTACKLGESLLLNLRGNVDEALPVIIERCMVCILASTNNTEDEDFVVTSSLYLHALELIVTSIFYNPGLSLTILAQHSWTEQFFTIWFKNLPKFMRVHDKKMAIGAICGIFDWLAASGDNPVAQQMAQNSNQLLVGALQLFKDFPEAIRARKELEVSYAEGREDEDEDDEEEEDDDDEVGEYDEEDIIDGAEDYLAQLEKHRAEQALDDDSDTSSTWSEEVLWASPLDSIDMYQRFKDTLTAIESSNPPLFQHATATLDGEHRAALEAIALRAAQGGENAETLALIEAAKTITAARTA